LVADIDVIFMIFHFQGLFHTRDIIHGAKPIEQKKILILGGGFAGIQVLRKV